MPGPDSKVKRLTARSSQLSSIVTTTAQQQCTVHQPQLGRLNRLNGLREIWTIYFVKKVSPPKIRYVDWPPGVMGGLRECRRKDHTDELNAY
jgi:hypothetical protein